MNPERRRFRERSQMGSPLALAPKSLDDFYEANVEHDVEARSGIGIVRVCGPLEHHASWFFDSYDAILERLECALADEEIAAVVLRIDSPGGDAAGATEAHRKIKGLRATYGKAIYAYADEAAYSAAYSIASACDEIWLPQTGGVGSVGVIGVALDVTAANEKAGVRVELLTSGARKADTHPDRELTDEIIDALQTRVDELAQAFFEVVAAGRGMPVAKVAALEAATFAGEKAVESGLADGVAGWLDFLGMVAAAEGLGTGGAFGVALGGTTDGDTSSMKTKLQLLNAITRAKASLEAATTDEERASAKAAIASATSAYESSKYFHKVTKKTKTEETEEGDDGDDDSDDDSDDDDDDDDKKKSKASAKSEDSEDEKSEEADDEDEKSADDDKKKMSSFSDAALFAMCARRRARARAARFGALAGIFERAEGAEKLTSRIVKLERNDRRAKVDAVLAKAKSEGKIFPGEIDGLREDAMEKGSSWLRARLEPRPRRLVTREMGGAREPVDGNGKRVATELAGLTPAEVDIVRTIASTIGKTVPEAAAIYRAKQSEKSNGAGERY